MTIVEEQLSLDIPESFNGAGYVYREFFRISYQKNVKFITHLPGIVNSNDFDYADDLFSDFEVEAEYVDQYTIRRVYFKEGVCILLTSDHMAASDKIAWGFTVGGSSKQIVSSNVEYITGLFKEEKEEPNKDMIRMKFWNESPVGPPVQNARDLFAHSWNEIESNYTINSRINLSDLVSKSLNLDGGKLILLHGEPGTGKTSFLRAISKEWKDVVESHYIIDPERFLTSPNYMYHVITKTSFYEKNKVKLLIVEDADEFLKTNAKQVTGQAMSRLLNLTDGLIGQGLKLLVLITTNEKMSEINKAVSRPGRCLANIEFEPFKKQEAINWLKEKGIDSEKNLKYVSDKMTLAQLYEIINREQVSTGDFKTSPGQYL
jgi:hypothetical protein